MKGKSGFINKSAETVILLKFEISDAGAIAGGHFSEGLAPVKLNGKYGYINRKGSVVIDFKYNSADSFKNGLAKVKTQNGEGYIGITTKNDDMTAVTIREYFEE